MFQQLFSLGQEAWAVCSQKTGLKLEYQISNIFVLLHDIFVHTFHVTHLIFHTFLLQVENHVREKITQELAEVCGAALSCRVEDMVTICDQILSGLEEESNIVIRRRRDSNRERNVSVLS